MSPEPYSTLEVSRQSVPYSDTQKQVVVGQGIQVASGYEGLEAAPKIEVAWDTATNPQAPPNSRSPRRKWLLFGIPILLIVIVGAVVGGVLGSRKNQKHETDTASSTASSTPTSSPVPSARTATRGGRNIAAVSFGDDTATTTRLYYQDNSGMLWEAETSTTNSSWSNRNLGISAKNGTALAAGVTQPGFPLQIRLVYTDADLVLHDYLYKESTNSWANDILINQKWVTTANSSLSTVWHQCSLCPNTSVIAFQDPNNGVQIGNLTVNGWVNSQVNDIQVQEDTELALQGPRTWGGESSINLWSQRPDLNISLDVFQDSEWVSGGVQPFTATASAPIAASNFMSNWTSETLNGWEVLWVFESTMKDATYTGTGFGEQLGWLDGFYSPSPAIPAATTGSIVDSIYSLAVTPNGATFASVLLQDGTEVIQMWRADVDIPKNATGLDWTPMGNVDIGSAWG